MPTQTTYAEVGADDKDVALFLCNHLVDLNLYSLPVKSWVARENGTIVAVLMLHRDPVPCLDFILADPSQRPFMRMYRLWRMAQTWLVTNNVPLICVFVHNTLVHYQSLLKRLGFARIGEQSDANGNPVETIFGWKVAA